MPFISSADADQNSYDVIVVGSGAGGGQTAYTLTMDGARVRRLEAGRRYDPASENPARQFQWWRARMLGGRTNHWGRISLRNGTYDFKPHTRDGLGFDWPM